MSPFFSGLILSIVMLSAVSCTNNHQTNTAVPPGAGRAAITPGVTTALPTSVDTVDVDSAMVYISNYGAFCSTYFSYMQTPPVRSFIVDSSDLVSLLGVSSLGTVKTVRIYVGIKATNVTSTSDADTSFHLYMVPVKSQPNGTVLYPDSIPVGVNGRQFVYDLTTPCPPTCDEFSKLYEAFTNSSISTIKWPNK